MFKSSIDYFPFYLIIGNTLYSFFNESTNMAMHSIVRNGALIKKVYIPKFIFPIASIMSSFVTMSFSLVAVLIVKIVMRVPFHIEELLLPIPLAFEFIFCMGVGMILAALTVYFRDIEHLYGVLTLAWMYLTPIFYSIEDMPSQVSSLIKLNPLYHYIHFFRLLSMNGCIPNIGTWLACIISSFTMFFIGLITFRKAQRSFILYI